MPVELTPREIWSLVLTKTKALLNPQACRLWLEPAEPVALSDNHLVVEVDSQFAVDYIEGQFGALLSRVARELLQRDLTISFQQRQSPARRSPEPPPAPVAPARSPGVPPHPLLNQRYTFETWVVGPGNQFASAAALAVAKAPARTYNPLFIYGGVGLGKTHLMQAIGAFVLQSRPFTRVHYASAETFMNEMIHSIQSGNPIEFRQRYRQMDLLLIDDIQFLANKESTQEEFFHTFNALYDAYKQIVLTSDRPPKEITNLEERLISRFQWGLVVDIQPPDLETRIAILQKKAERDGLAISPDVMLFLAKNIKSNVRELEGSLIRLLAHASLTGAEISVEVAKEVLKTLLTQEGKRVTVEKILREVARHFEVTLDGLKSPNRSKNLAFPRQVAMFLCRQLTELPLVEIGQAFGGRDHTTVMHACGKVTGLIQRDVTLAQEIQSLREVLVG